MKILHELENLGREGNNVRGFYVKIYMIYIIQNTLDIRENI